MLGNRRKATRCLNGHHEVEFDGDYDDDDDDDEIPDEEEDDDEDGIANEGDKM